MVVIKQLMTPRKPGATGNAGVAYSCNNAACKQQVDALWAEIQRLQDENEELQASHQPTAATGLALSNPVTSSLFSKIRGVSEFFFAIYLLTMLPGLAVMANALFGAQLVLHVLTEIIDLELVSMLILPSIFFWFCGFNWPGFFKLANLVLYSAYLLFWALFVGKVFEAIYENL